MKKTIQYLALAILVIITAAGCSKSGNDDSASLLRTVPADASSVVMMNIGHTAKSLGCKTDGTTIKLSDKLQKALDESKAIKDDDRRLFKDICEGKTGIALTTVVYFSAARSYLTGLLDDPDKFVDYISRMNATDSVSAAPVKEEDGGRVIGATAVVGNQFWVCVTGTPDVEQLRYYQNLNEKQSYASSDASELLRKDDEAVTYVADISRTLNSIPEAGKIRMATSMMFEDIAYVAGSANFSGNTFKASAMVLDSDMKPAELTLPTEKIDASVIKSFGQGADLYFAAGLSQKLTKKLADLAGTLMGPSGNTVSGPISQIDGTIAIRANDNAAETEVRVQTTGKDFAELSNIIQNLSGMTVTRDGNMLAATRGSKEFSGNISPSEAAGRMKGAWIGFTAYNIPYKEMTTTARLSTEKKSLRLDVDVEGGTDAILTALMR